MASRENFEAAAAQVLGILKGISDFGDASVAVIGGLALWKYLPEGRTTQVRCGVRLHTHLTSVSQQKINYMITRIST